MKQRIFVTPLLLLAGCGRAPPAGPVLLYQIDPATKPAGMADGELTEKMLAAIDRRINSHRSKRAKVAALGDGKIEVRVDRGDWKTASDIQRLLSHTGNLEFRIVAHRHHPEMGRWIDDTAAEGPYPFPEPVLRNSTVVARWMPVEQSEHRKSTVAQRVFLLVSRQSGVPLNDLSATRPMSDLAADSPAMDALWTTLEQGFTAPGSVVEVPPEHRKRLHSLGDVTSYLVAAPRLGLHGEIAWNIDARRGLMLLLVEPLADGGPRDRRELRYPAVTGDALRRAAVQHSLSGYPSIGFALNEIGAPLLRRLTLAYAPAADGFQSRLAILLDGVIHSAPSLREPIIDGAGQISGEFTLQEAEDLVDALNAGALPAGLKLIDQRTTAESGK